MLLGDEQQVDAQVVAAHQAHHVDRALVGVVEPQQQVAGQVTVGELPDRVEHHVQGVGVEACRGRSPVMVLRPS